MMPRDMPAAALMRAAQDAPARPGRPTLYAHPRRVTIVEEQATVTAWLLQARADGLTLTDWIKKHLPS